jgi:hypothetical protein
MAGRISHIWHHTLAVLCYKSLLLFWCSLYLPHARQYMRCAYMMSWVQQSHTLSKLVPPSVKESFRNLIFQVLMAIMKVIAFWDASPCSLIEVDWCFRGAYCLHHQGNEALMIEEVHISKMSSLLQWDYMALYPRRLSSSFRNLANFCLEFFLVSEDSTSEVTWEQQLQQKLWHCTLCWAHPFSSSYAW